ncbi:hypothetical protein [Pantoea dispersa]|uniref:hypothetical protein n=1 Tax=Pantoea dispersa TaxID=59814 RepID=UPI003AFB502F
MVGSAGGVVGGAYGSAAMAGVCAAVGIATVGVGGVACAVVGSVAGGYLGSTGAEAIVNKVTELLW